MFRMIDHPVSVWPRWVIHYPPLWLWSLVRLMPLSRRVKLVDWVADAPGMCAATAFDLVLDDGAPWEGLSSRTCRPDSEYNHGPCWCGKYQTAAEWAKDMEGAKLLDPLADFTVTFLGRGGEA